MPLAKYYLTDYLTAGGLLFNSSQLHSGGLKQFRGSWLCLNLGSFTWRPPVKTGPRE